MRTTTSMSVILNNVSPEQFEAINKLLAVDTEETAAKAKRAKPTNTVSEEEDEDFGTSAMDEDDLTETEEDAVEEEEEPAGVTFAELKAAINKYGEKHPDQMRAILAGFNIKSPKELASTKNEKYWQPVYEKVMAKLKAVKKK